MHKEHMQFQPNGVNFFKLYQEVENYLKGVEASGPHSFHGLFYRQQAHEKQAQMVVMIEKVIKDSGRFEMTFADLVESIKQEKPYISASQVMYELLDAGSKIVEGKVSFEDIVVQGMVEMGGT